QEARALSADERELVEKSRPPALQSLSDSALLSLVKRMRERRNRARTVAERQRRELRGKARARGATPIRADEGSRLKLSVLSTALGRLDAEMERRRRARAKTSMVESAKKALALKQEAGGAAPSGRRSANPGLRGKARVTVESHV